MGKVDRKEKGLAGDCWTKEVGSYLSPLVVASSLAFVSAMAVSRNAVRASMAACIISSVCENLYLSWMSFASIQYRHFQPREHDLAAKTRYTVLLRPKHRQVIRSYNHMVTNPPLEKVRKLQRLHQEADVNKAE